MIPLIQKTFAEQGRELSFLKYSTPTSGHSPMDKVLFFGFEPNKKYPSVVVKSVRDPRGGEAIVHGFEKLQRLCAMVAGTPLERLFAQPICFYDGESVWSAESACLGERRRLSEKDLALVIRDYTAFQVRVALSPLRDIDSLSSAILSSDKHLTDVYQALPTSNLQVPHVPQLGDLTPDNILFSNNGVSIVDCDYLDTVDMPGFDLVTFLARIDRKHAKALCDARLPAYLRAIGAVSEGPLDRLYFLAFVAERRLRKQQLGSSRELTEAYASLFAQ